MANGTVVEGRDVVKALEDRIREKTSSVSPSPFSPTSCIFRVPEVLRRHNPLAYQPDAVSIGPFHRGSKQLQPMEKVKHWYLGNFLSRMNTSPQVLINVIMQDENRARKFYGESLDHLDRIDFIEMMILDGCFIVELFWKKKHSSLKDEFIIKNDPIFNMACMFQYICHDLLLLENQLPWFILECIYDRTQPKYPLNILMLSVFGSHPPLSHNCKSYINYLINVGAAHHHKILHVLDLMRTSITFPVNHQRDPSSKFSDSEIRLLHSATALSESGIKFIEKNPGLDHHDSIISIEFKDGVFRIPQLTIGELTESLFRNLIAFEQCYHDRPPQITSYAVLMDNLIGSSNDMKFLCEKGIIGNWLSAEDGSQFFNKLYNDTFLTEFCYHGLCRDVNKYYEVKWKTWLERLKRDHFSNPWKAISVFAACILLVLTALQTSYTISPRQ